MQEFQALGYRMVAKKSQLCTSEDTYLGYQLCRGKMSLYQNRIATIFQIPLPKLSWDLRQVQEFLAITMYCCLCIPEFMEIARPVYINTNGGSKSIIWTEIKQKPFETLETALTSAPALVLLVVLKPFHLFVQKTKDITRGILNPNLWAVEISCDIPVRMIGPCSYSMADVFKSYVSYCQSNETKQTRELWVRILYS